MAVIDWWKKYSCGYQSKNVNKMYTSVAFDHNLIPDDNTV